MDWYYYIGLLCILTSLFYFLKIILDKDSYSSIGKTISEHFRLYIHTSKNDSSENKKIGYSFYIFPTLFSIGVTFFFRGNSDFYSNITVIVSIMMSMLFATIGLLYVNNIKEIGSINIREKIAEVTSQTITAILYSVYIGVILLLTTLLMTVILESKIENIAMECFGTFVIILLFTIFVVNLLIIIKRLGNITKFHTFYDDSK